MKEQLKKLSDLKENEYVYCENSGEQKRIFNTTLGMYTLNDKNGQNTSIEEISKKGTFIVHPSKDIADYEPPVPVKPNKNNYWNDGQYEWANYALDLEKYADHLEKELEEVKSKAFIPFKVKCIGDRDCTECYDVTLNDTYEAIAEDSGYYCILDDSGDLVVIDRRYFTKID